MTSSTWVNKKEWSGLFAFLTLIGMWLRARAFSDRPLSQDEIEQIRKFPEPLLKTLLEYLPHIPGGFPGDYLLTKPLGLISTNKWIITLPHIVLTGLGFFLLYKICAEDFKEGWAMLVVLLLFVFNRHLAYHAFEIRPYAVLPTLALGVLVGLKAVRKDAWSLTEKIGWGAFIFTVALFHAYGAMMLGLVIGYHLLFSRSVPWRVLVQQLGIVTLIASCLTFPIWLFYASPGFHLKYGVDPFLYVECSFVGFIKFVFGNISDFSVHRGWLAVLVFFVGGLFIRGGIQRGVYLLLLLVLPTALIIYSDIKSGYWIVQRQIVWVMPLWALLIGHTMEAVLSLWGARETA